MRGNFKGEVRALARRVLAVAMSLVLAVAFVPAAGLAAQPATAYADDLQEDRVTLTLIANGGMFEVWNEEKQKDVESATHTVSVLKGKDDSFFYELKRDGYRLLGWDENKDATVPTYAADGLEGCTITASADMTLYAVWAKREFTTLTLTCPGAVYEAWVSGGESVRSDADGKAELQVAVGEENVVNVQPDVKNKIGDWTVQGDGSATYSGYSFTVVPEGPMTLTATKRDVETVTINYHGNGGKIPLYVEDSVGADNDTLVYAKEDAPFNFDVERVPFRDYDPVAHRAYRFLGYSRAQGATVPEYEFESGYSYGNCKLPLDDFGGSDTLDLYAVWKPIESWNVTLDANGGHFQREDEGNIFFIDSSGEHVARGQGYQTDVEFWEGHKLLGWSTTADGAVEYPAPADEDGEWPVIENINGDITLYAVWDTDPGAQDTPVTPAPTPVPAAEPAKQETTTPVATDPAPALAVGETTATKAGTFEATSAGEVAYAAAPKKSSVSIPATVTVDGQTYKVTEIADKAFKGNKKVTKVTVGANVETIGAAAFQKCAKLKTVKLGAAVTEIEKGAFQGCKKLKTVKLNKALEEVDANAFKGCTALTSVTFPAHVESIAKGAFGGCKNLKSITFKTQLLTAKSVGVGAFKGTPSNATVKCGKKLADYKKFLPKKGISKKATFKK